MVTLLNNQECKLDNHQAGQQTQGLKGLHIHKTYKKNKDYSTAEIRIPLDGEKTQWSCKGNNAEKLRRECEKALRDPQKNKDFVNVVIKEMKRFDDISHNKNLTSEELDKKHSEIAKNVLEKGFCTGKLSLKEVEHKSVFGHNIRISHFENDDYNYSSFLGKNYSIYRGKNKRENG